MHDGHAVSQTTSVGLHMHPHLVVSAIGARHQLPEGLAGREPCLEVILLRRRIVQLSRHDVDNMVGDLQSLSVSTIHIRVLRSIMTDGS